MTSSITQHQLQKQALIGWQSQQTDALSLSNTLRTPPNDSTEDLNLPLFSGQFIFEHLVTYT